MGARRRRRRRRAAHRRLHEGHLHRADGRSGYAAASSVAAGDLDAERARRAAPREGARRRRAGRAAARRVPGGVRAARRRVAVRPARPDARSTGSPTPRAAARSTASSATTVAAPAINLADSPAHPRTLPRSFDAEGTPKAPLPLIQDGVARGVAHDIRSAALAGTARSRPATRSPRAATPSGPQPTNLVLAGGGAADEAELCAPIERGVYVTRLWYANVVRPKETLITAVTRDGTFLIEDGRVTRPLRDLRLTDSVLSILSRTQRALARARGSRATASSTAAASRTEWSARRSARTRCASPARRLELDSSAGRARSPRTAARRRSSSGSGCARRAIRHRTGPLRCRRRRRRSSPASLPECSRIEHDQDDREDHLNVR